MGSIATANWGARGLHGKNGKIALILISKNLISMELNYECIRPEMEENKLQLGWHHYIGALTRDSGINVLSHTVGRVLIIFSFCCW